MTDDLELRIAKLRLGPNDILIVKASERLSAQSGDRITAQIRHIVGDKARVMLLDPRFDISVMTKAEIDAKVQV